jgi:hypothetical protein
MTAFDFSRQELTMHRAWWVAGGAARRNGAISWPLTCEVLKRVGHGRA